MMWPRRVPVAGGDVRSEVRQSRAERRRRWSWISLDIAGYLDITGYQEQVRNWIVRVCERHRIIIFSIIII